MPKLQQPSRRTVELIMLRADRFSVMPGKYRKSVREIFRFAADAAQKILEEMHRDGQRSREGTTEEASESHAAERGAMGARAPQAI